MRNIFISLAGNGLHVRPFGQKSCEVATAGSGGLARRASERHAQASLALRGVRGAIVVVRLQLGRVPQVVQWASVVEAEGGAFPAVQDHASHGLAIWVAKDIPIAGHKIARTVEQRQKLRRRRVGAAVMRELECV